MISNNMHLSFHWAIGMIIASLSSINISMNFWLFGFIVLCAVFADFDIILRKHAIDNNHRMLFTHSIYIPLILIIFGILFSQTILIFGGISYLAHIFADLLDWGTNLFFTGKIYGPRFLLQKDERNRVKELMYKEENPAFFFVKRYYQSTLMISLEIIAIISTTPTTMM